MWNEPHSMWNESHSMWNEPHSMWNPYGIHGMDPFHVDSIWNVGGAVKYCKGPLTYKLKLPETWCIHDTFHATLLMPYVETETHGPNYTRPPPDIDNEEE